MAGKLNWLVVGIGDIAVRRVIPAILREPRSRLAAVVTRDPAKAAAYGVRAFHSLSEAIAGEPVDAVYLATPVALHKPQTLEALAAGKAVICEKPMALNLEEAQQMADAAQSAGKPLAIAYYRRHYPKVLRAVELMRQGAIGRPVFAEGINHGWFHAGNEHRAWLLDPAMSGGGPLYDIGSHRIDLLNFLFGKPISALGQLSNVVHQGRVEDSATTLIEYESGVRGVVDVRWHCREYRDDFRITGTEGAIDLSPLNSGHLGSPAGEENLPPDDNLHYPLIENFAAHLIDGEPLLSTAATALATAWVTEEVVRQARVRQGGEVRQK